MTKLEAAATKLGHSLHSLIKLLKDKNYGVGAQVKLTDTQNLLWGKHRGEWGLWVVNKSGDFLPLDNVPLEIRARVGAQAPALMQVLVRNSAIAAVDIEEATGKINQLIASTREEMKQAAEAKAYMSRDRSDDHKK